MAAAARTEEVAGGLGAEATGSGAAVEVAGGGGGSAAFAAAAVAEVTARDTGAARVT
jgi:hypothetical protein